jgi:hypothetical protein
MATRPEKLIAIPQSRSRNRDAVVADSDCQSQNRTVPLANRHGNSPPTGQASDIALSV